MNIADAHSDLLMELAHRGSEENPFATRWLPNLRQGGVQLQVCALYAEPESRPEGALRQVFGQVAAFYRALRENGDTVVFVGKSQDVRVRCADTRLRLLLSLEGLDSFGRQIEALEVFWALGVRIYGLTWNHGNAFADGLGEPNDGGLTSLGKRLVPCLSAYGAIVDLAHASEKTFWQTLDLMAPGQVIVSHAACRALVDTPRNLSDDALKAISDHGGVVGIMIHPHVIGAEAGLTRVVEHIEHAMAIMGEERVVLGGDFIKQIAASGAIARQTDALPGMRLGATLAGLEGPEDYPALMRALRDAGIRDQKAKAVASANLLAFLERSLPRDE